MGEEEWGGQGAGFGRGPVWLWLVGRSGVQSAEHYEAMTLPCRRWLCLCTDVAAPGSGPVRDLLHRTKRALAGLWQRVRALLPKVRPLQSHPHLFFFCEARVYPHPPTSRCSSNTCIPWPPCSWGERVVIACRFCSNPQVVRRRVGQTCEDTDGPSTAHDKDKAKDKGEPASPYTVDPTRAILTILTPQQMDVVRKAHTGEGGGARKRGHKGRKGLLLALCNDVSLYVSIFVGQVYVDGFVVSVAHAYAVVMWCAEVVGVAGLVARGAKVGMVINEEMVARYDT